MEQYIDAVVDAVLNMYKDKSKITVDKRDCNVISLSKFLI